MAIYLKINIYKFQLILFDRITFIIFTPPPIPPSQSRILDIHTLQDKTLLFWTILNKMAASDETSFAVVCAAFRCLFL